MDDDAPLGTRAWAVVLAGVGVAAWVVPMARSLWLDETLTWWVVDGSVAQTVDRAWTYQQSPFAYLLMWPFARLDGASEALLRVPSLVAAIVGAVLLWRLAERLVGRSAGPIAVLAWMGTWATIEASDARPYALALACTIGATLMLVRTLDRPTIVRGAAYGILAASMLWAHYLFAVVLPVHLLYTIVRHRRGAPRLPIAPTIAAIAAGTVAVAPLVGQVVSLWSRRQALATGGSSVLVAPLLIANLALIPAAIATLVLTRGRVHVVRTAVASADRTLIVMWCLVPPLLLWLVSEVSAPYFINGRYLVSATPAVALLAAWAIACIRPPAARRVLVVALAVWTAVGALLWGHREDDWRGAIAVAAGASDADTLVLARVRLVEAKQVDWLTDPERRSYVLAPFAFYPLGTDPVPLPLFPHDEGADVYLDALLAGPVAATDRFVLIEQGDEYRTWLDGRLGPLGWSSRILGEVDEPQVVEFVRAPG